MSTQNLKWKWKWESKLQLGLCWFELEMVQPENVKQTNMWNQTTLKEYLKECPKSLRYLGETFISHEKMVTSNLIPPLSLLGVVAKGLESTIYFLFHCCFEPVHRKDVPLLLLGFDPIVLCSSFDICNFLYHWELFLFQQFLLILPFVTITMHFE
jgi:hypothetical protein